MRLKRRLRRRPRSLQNSLRSVRLSRMPRSLSLCGLTGTFLITFKKPGRAGKTATKGSWEVNRRGGLRAFDDARSDRGGPLRYPARRRQLAWPVRLHRLRFLWRSVDATGRSLPRWCRGLFPEGKEPFGARQTPQRPASENVHGPSSNAFTADRGRQGRRPRALGPSD